MLLWALLEIFLTSAVICKQRFLHENEVVHNLKTKNTKTLIKAILEAMKNNDPKTTIHFFMGRSIFSYIYV